MSNPMTTAVDMSNAGQQERKGSFLLALLVLTVTIGFPRVYGTEVPMAVLLMPFYMLGFLRLLMSNGGFAIAFLLLFGGWLLGGAVVATAGAPGDLFFHFVVSSKIFLNIFFGYVIHRVLTRRPSALLAWIILQCGLATISIVDREVYVTLLGFISPRSAEVFQHIYGLRALGFGLFHVDGALTLVITVFYYLLISQKSFLKSLLVIMIFPVAMAIARSAIIPFAILGLSRRGVGLKVLLLLSVVTMVVLSFYVTSGPLYQATEIFRNIVVKGEFHSDSVQSLSEMYIYPDRLSTYLYGDGRYFSEDTSELGFYKGTDVGYLRILYFSGLGSVVVFMLLNCFYLVPILFGGRYEKSRDIKVFALALFLIFVIVNFKGLQVMPIFAVSLFLFAGQQERDTNRQAKLNRMQGSVA
ncbi:hypothetical protein AAUI01_02110 [Pseudomonas mosselii]|uniref:hypothetical protein n=2 Tax=Pseudomonas mosselii TaxID=78327 RepID=UPI00258FBFEF|nr:hypothetical protein [uncultured Pseudomonas sp.]